MATTAVVCDHIAVCSALLFMGKATFGQECMAVYNWVEKFLQGPWEQEDKDIIGHLLEIMIDMAMSQVEAVIKLINR